MRLLFLLAAGTTLGSPAIAADQLKFGPPPSWVVPQPIPANVKAGSAPIAVLMTDQQIAFENGKITSYQDAALRIDNPEGLSAGNVSVMWQPSTDAVTVNKLQIIRDGKVIDVLASGQTFTTLRRETNLDAATLDGTLTANIQPEGMQVGDIVELATTTVRSDPVLRGHVESVFGSWNGIAVNSAHALITWPEKSRINLRISDNLPKPRRSTEAGRSILQLFGQDLQPIVPPKGAPERFLVGRIAEATDFQSWNDVADLMLPLFNAASTIPASGPLHDEVEKIRSSTSDPKTRAEMALSLAEDRVRYVALEMGTGGLVPASAELTWSRRFGDCKAKVALLLAVLHALGIDADPVLVEATAGDLIADRLPMVGLFNHAIVRAHVAGKDHWLDATKTGDTKLDSIAVPDFGWVLPLVPNAALVHLVPSPLALPSLERQVNVDATSGLYSPASVSIDEIYRGDYAVALNSVYSAFSSDQRNEALRSEGKGFFDDIAVASSSAEFDKDKRTFTIAIKGTAKLDWKDSWFHVPTSSIGFNPDFDRPAGPLHDVPIAVSHPRYAKDLATIRLPSGVAAKQKISPAVQETLAGVEYRRIESLSGDVISVDSSERSLVEEVAYKDAVAAEARLKALDNDDVYLQVPQGYQVTKADTAAQLAAAPASSEGLVQKGAVLSSSGKYDEAIAAFNQALAIDPHNAEALGGRLAANVSKGDLKAAEKDAAALAEARPGEAATAALTGYLQIGKNQLPEAEASFSTAIRARPDAIVWRLARGQVLLAENKWEDALADFNAILARDPSNFPALMNRAAAYQALGQQDLALADTETILKQGKPQPQLRLTRANIFKKQGKHDLVLREAELLIEENPESDFALVAAGKIYSAEGDRAKALDAINRALAIHPYAYIYLNRENVREKGDLEGRLADVDMALKIDPEVPQALRVKAWLLLEHGDYAEAITTFDAGIAKDPATGLDLRRGRAIALYKHGQAAEATKAMTALLAEAKSAYDLNMICWETATAGVMLDSALDACRKAVALSPEVSGFQDSLGMALLRLNKLDEAIMAYTGALAKSPVAASYMGRAFAYAQKGDMGHANADRTEAINLDPDIESEFAEYGLQFPGPKAQASK